MRRKGSYTDGSAGWEQHQDYTQRYTIKNDDSSRGNERVKRERAWDADDTHLFFVERIVAAMRRGLEQHRIGVKPVIMGGGGLAEEPAGIAMPSVVWDDMSVLVNKMAGDRGLSIACSKRFSDPAGVVYVKFSRAAG